MAGGYHLKKKKNNFSTNLIEVQVSLKKQTKKERKKKKKWALFTMLLINYLFNFNASAWRTNEYEKHLNTSISGRQRLV